LIESALRRDFRSIEKDGSSKLQFNGTPFLTIGGSSDGLMRITRFAEDFYHAITNNQDKNVDATVVDDLTHGGWLESQPQWIIDNDLPSLKTKE